MNTAVTVGYLLAAIAVWSFARSIHRLVIAHRSPTWKLALTVAGLGLGTGPALAGRPFGYLGVALGGLASASLVADHATAHGRLTPPRPHRRRRGPGPGGDSAAPPGPLTELDQAALHLTTVRATHTRLVKAAAAGDLRGQHRAAQTIGAAARQLRDALAVVLDERDLLDRTH